MKFLITILTSSNIVSLHLCYESIINQKNHNLDYSIVIIVNSLNKNYYNEVLTDFNNKNVNIIQTESNGKPGKGHNSIFQVFYENDIYDYLISIDGDDFFYPYALHQLSKCFTINPDLDCVCLYTNDKIVTSNYSNTNDLYILNNFYFQSSYLTPKKINYNNFVNPFKVDLTNGICTLLRFCMCSRKFALLNINKELYCTNSFILDDYKFYLHFIELIHSKKINGFIINGDHIYLYNSINNFSVSNNKNKFILDYNTISNYLDSFNYLNTHLPDWDLSFIPYYNLSNVFNEDLEFKLQLNNVYSFNYNNIFIKKNYTYLIDFVKYITNKYYEMTIKYINKNLLIKLDRTNINNILNQCLYLVDNKIYDRELFIYTAICFFYKKCDENCIKYIELSDYKINNYKVLLDFYNNYKKNIKKSI